MKNNAMNEQKTKTPPLLIRPEFRRMFDKLSNEDTGALIHALMGYRWDGVIPELPSHLDGVFLALQAFADEDVARYQERCNRNRESANKRWGKGNDDATECE